MDRAGESFGVAYTDVTPYFCMRDCTPVNIAVSERVWTPGSSAQHRDRLRRRQNRFLFTLVDAPTAVSPGSVCRCSFVVAV